MLILDILRFFVVLSLLILIHELGHYWMAKRAGIWVEEFGFGLPPRAWGKKIGDTIYSINWLPFGGFVRLHGEQDEEGVTKPDRAFVNKSKRARMSIVVAGVFMNLVLAIVAFSIVSTASGIPRATGQVVVNEVVEESPAAEAGLVAGDVFKSVEETEIKTNEEFIQSVNNIEEEGNFIVFRNGEELSLSIAPKVDEESGAKIVGVSIQDSEVYFPPFWQRPFYGIYYGFLESLFWIQMVIGGFVYIFSSLFSGQVPQGIAGPVGIYAITTEVASTGILSLIKFVGILSVNLSVLNILPFPALDGGRLLFIALEGIIGKKVLPKIEGYIHMAGMIILLLLIVAITAGDVIKLVQAGSIKGFLDTFTP